MWTRRRRGARSYARADITNLPNTLSHWHCLLLRRVVPAAQEVVHQPRARARKSTLQRRKTCQRSPSSPYPRHASQPLSQQDWLSDTDCAAPARLPGDSVALGWQTWEASMPSSIPITMMAAATAQHRYSTQVRLNTRPPLPPQQPSLKASSQ